MSPMSRARGWVVASVTAVLVTALAVIAVPGADRESASGTVDAPLPPLPLPTDAQGAHSSAGADARDEAVRALLDRRARAVLDGDEQAFLATVDPAADDAFRASQRAMFANLADVPLTRWSYRILRPSSAMPRPPEIAGTALGETAAPEVELRYALAGVDAVSTGKPMGFLFVRRDGRWYLHSDTALEHEGRHTWRGPWHFGPCVVLRTEHGLVLGHPDDVALAERVAAQLDPAVRAVDRVWGRDWTRQAAVLLPASTAEFQAQAGTAFALEDIAALAIADFVDTDSGRVSGQRVVLNPLTAYRLSDAALGVVLRHEITHVAARAHTEAGAPMWMLEGFADHVGYRDSGLAASAIAPDLAEHVRRFGPPERLPEDHEFHAGGRRLDLAYQTSWSLLDFLARTHGDAAVVSFYRLLAIHSSPDARDVDDAARTAFGAGAGDLLDRWRADLTRLMG